MTLGTVNNAYIVKHTAFSLKVLHGPKLSPGDSSEAKEPTVGDNSEIDIVEDVTLRPIPEKEIGNIDDELLSAISTVTFDTCYGSRLETQIALDQSTDADLSTNIINDGVEMNPTVL